MNFTLIKQETWDRKEYFEHYFNTTPCTYSLCAKVEITAILERGLKLYPAMLYCITTIVNRHEEFRTAFNDRSELGIYDKMIPSYTIFHKETHTFSVVWTEYDEDYNVFCKNYETDISTYKEVAGFHAKPNIPCNCFNISMIPWVTFEGFNLNLKNGYNYLLPIFTMGKYIEEKEKWYIPVAIQVHHAICDGFHVSRFIRELQQLINTIA